MHAEGRRFEACRVHTRAVTSKPIGLCPVIDAMASTKDKGDLAEVKVLSDLIERGHKVAVPYGENWDFDLVLYRDQKLERVQVKYVEATDGKMVVKCHSHSLTNGKVRATKVYTSETVDWIAVYEKTGDRCYYVPSSVFDGNLYITLRLEAPKNGQVTGVRFASEFEDLGM